MPDAALPADLGIRTRGRGADGHGKGDAPIRVEGLTVRSDCRQAQTSELRVQHEPRVSGIDRPVPQAHNSRHVGPGEGYGAGAGTGSRTATVTLIRVPSRVPS